MAYNGGNMPMQAWAPQAQMVFPGANGFPMGGSDFPREAGAPMMPMQSMNPPATPGKATDAYGMRSVGDTSLRVGEPAHLGWSDVSFTLSPKAVKASGKDPRILKNLHGKARPGEVVALMGASGCGKTSLMNVLAGRATSMNGHVVTANITVNGKAVTAAELGPKVAYVMQEDSLTATATPREAFDFSARLRLPPTVTAEERKTMVDEMIRILHLERCADTMIGNELIKGISGGEKKRVSIGVELITQPSILFLDEPTSGLDSYAAYNIINILKDLARLGCTVISTIHQPSSEVFHLFDRVLLLTSGRLLYDGPVDGADGALPPPSLSPSSSHSLPLAPRFLFPLSSPWSPPSLVSALPYKRARAHARRHPSDATLSCVCGTKKLRASPTPSPWPFPAPAPAPASSPSLPLSDRTPGMSEYFKRIGYPVPPETNPAGVTLKCARFHVVHTR